MRRITHAAASASAKAASAHTKAAVKAPMTGISGANSRVRVWAISQSCIR